MKVFIIFAAIVATISAGTIDPELLRKVKAGKVHHAILELPEVVTKVSNNLAVISLQGDEKVAKLVSLLEETTKEAQASYVSLANNLGLTTQQFWASNIILVKGLNNEKLQKLASAPGDFLIREEATASVNPAVPAVEVNITQNVQWGVSQIRAPAAWALTQGEGVVVGIIDTGCNVGHVALSRNYAGQWRDPYYNDPNPTDTHGHGSHALGSIVGSANGVGVAPAAQWVCCRGLNNQGSGTEANLVTCGQFMVTSNPRPQVVSNSWGGGQGSTWYNSVVSTWRAANIVPVFALGNAGAACRSANSPGDQPNLLSASATTNTDAMASHSARGRSLGGLMKPELSAPGNNIVSCGTGTNNYATMSGTSMACPHIAGAVALYLSANPGSTFDQIYMALANSAAHPTLTNADRNCGLENGNNDFPNNAYGHGRIDIGRALGV